VESFTPNEYGLFDMAGNVYEWCWDWHDPKYYRASPGTDPRGPASGTSHVLRGGGWSNYGYDGDCRVAARFHSGYPVYRLYVVGFRTVVSRVGDPSPAPLPFQGPPVLDRTGAPSRRPFGVRTRR
jgi:formylglycine-generating enzyme required for sulfatase activity